MTYVTSVSVAALEIVTSTVERIVDISCAICITVATRVASWGTVTKVVLVTVEVSLSDLLNLPSGPGEDGE